MHKTLFYLAMISMSATFVACDDEGEIDICSDDIDCNDGFICEITGQDDGVCIEGVTE